MLFFLLLAGVRESTPLDQIFFFEFDTSEISSSLPNPVRWTLYSYCGVSASGRNINCTSRTAGLAFEPQNVFDTTTGIPQDIIDNRDTYYYLTKISFAFYLITAFFAFVSFLLSTFACFSRLGGAASAFINFLALLFVAAASSMTTAAYVMARNAFSGENVESSLGVKAFAFTWAIVACLLLSFLLLCCSCALGRHNGGMNSGTTSHALQRESSFERTYDNDKPRGRGFFNVSRRKEEPSAFFAENDNTAIEATPRAAA